ncbi:DUF3558 domain-containing protein [Nocardia sp. NBC_00508]|uniref:DUF3558 domain-containing protein n=1 Tax=Nocardia sp. NBC_00508 TaxID=2975992 RepID=UPI002E80E0C0|nr:DUF3558 domain-containing protein [Nocardia sp. NBC_00508]WUD64169.1 DUF3558 domain-containing protein [Nocardia sp. NBC_00508]
MKLGSAARGTGFALAATGVVLLAACGGRTTATESPTPTTPGAAGAGSGASTGAGSPAAFDPCTALTPQLLAQRRWDAEPPEPKQDSQGGVTWKGCRYVAKAGYGFVVETTNGTLDQVRGKYPAAVDISAGDRKAVRYEARPDVPGGCTVNVEMRSGSLYILTNVPQTSANKNLVACDIATDIARTIAPLLPSGS